MRRDGIPYRNRIHNGVEYQLIALLRWVSTKATMAENVRDKTADINIVVVAIARFRMYLTQVISEKI